MIISIQLDFLKSSLFYLLSLLFFTNYMEIKMYKESKTPAKQSLIGWIIEFAGEKKGQYITSVFFALLSVACCIALYFMSARIVRQHGDNSCTRSSGRYFKHHFEPCTDCISVYY